MEIPLRPPRGVKLHSLYQVLLKWKTSFTLLEKIGIGFVVLLLILTSWRWALAASQYKEIVPTSGGAFIEGVVGSSIDTIDLGRLTKSGLVRLDQNGQIGPDLATKWEISPDYLTYKFTIDSRFKSNDIADTVSKNPTAVSQATVTLPDQNTISFALQQPDINFLSELSKPLFPYGPYKVDKKTATEIRLKINPDYFGDKPFIDKVTVRLYDNQDALQKAANKNEITGAMNLDKLPDDWQEKTLTMNKKHILFINSAKPYLKSVDIRAKILNAQKPDSITSLDVLEVNGVSTDPDYEAFKAKLTAAGFQLNVRQVALKDALSSDLPKRSYDLLYILVSESPSQDPYLYYNSAERSGIGQNFGELANANIDKLTNDYRQTNDAVKRVDLLTQINEAVAKEKVVVEYKNLTSKYAVSPKIKGFSVANIISRDADRFDQVAKWYISEKKIR